MRSRAFLLPLVLGLLLTPPLLLVAIASAGAGHGNYFWAKVLFPFTLLSVLVFDSITTPFIALAVIQFPCYGLILGKANVRGRLGRYAGLLLLIHSLAVIACFVLANANFS